MVRQVYHSLRDGVELLIGWRERSVPPRRLAGRSGIRTGSEEEELIHRIIELAGLKPDAAVLEVGCGCGHSARLLARRLAGSGAYWGFDVDPESIAWCRKHIEVDHPNFFFRLADVCDETFQPKGRFNPQAYRFPYLDNFFDCVLVPAAFKRMPSAVMANYLAQVRRVLKPGGRCVSSFFLLNCESRRLLDRGRGRAFVFKGDRDWRFYRANRTNASLVHEEAFVRDCCARHGLEMLEPIDYGNWCGRKAFHYPDILMAVKPLGTVAKVVWH